MIYTKPAFTPLANDKSPGNAQTGVTGAHFVLHLLVYLRIVGLLHNLHNLL